jgi:hippurate hydrolase
MRINDAISNAMPELVAVRRELHAHPELGLEEVWTSDYVARHLEGLGYEVHRGLARTGVVATLKCGSSPRSIGLRADMDALPIEEQTGKPYASTITGKMHACGHDGHTAMLLGAAREIAERRNFDGTVHLIFQPAEENVGGARIMVEEGLFEKFPCDAVFALHNEPSLPFGRIAVREGPVMAAVDEARITVRGRGGHGAHPEDTADPVVAASAIVMALQSIVSRNVHPLEPAVVTVGSIHGGSASNIIPDAVRLVIGIRSFDEATRDFLERRITEIARLQAESFGSVAEVDYERSYDATFNHAAETAFLRERAVRFAGTENVIDLERPYMGSEDFAYMLKAVPGSYFFLGAGRGSGDRSLHHPEYDFNDDLLPVGVAFWTDLVEAYLPAEAGT